jgi:hypothetical protein
LKDLEEAMEKITDQKSANYINLSATRMETINQIKATKADIQNKKDLFNDYEFILSQIRTLKTKWRQFWRK